MRPLNSSFKMPTNCIESSFVDKFPASHKFPEIQNPKVSLMIRRESTGGSCLICSI
jgi:hypothetical protein